MDLIRRRRGPLMLAAAAAFAVRIGVVPVPEPSLSALAARLGHEVSGAVSEQDVFWQPSRGFVGDLVLGRRVLFLARPDGTARDVFRAEVRVSPEGQVLDVRGVVNLTNTPVGDDAGLRVVGDSAVYATTAFGRVQALSVLEINGVRPADKPAGLFDRMLLALSSLQATGSLSGVGRTDLVLEVPPKKVTFQIGDGQLRLQTDDASEGVEYDLQARSARTDSKHAGSAIQVRPHQHHPKPFILWAVDTVRAEVGPEPIAWLERYVFDARDKVKRATYSIFHHGDAEIRAEPDAAASTGDAAFDSFQWPPRPLGSRWTKTEPGEGQWAAVRLPWLKTLAAKGADTPPPYFYQTFVRPDQARPYVKVYLIAMDMRQLELGMQAGYEDPRPLVGPPGTGHIPHDADVIGRVVGAFNGAFKTTHGGYGMMVDRRVLIPPVKRGATVLVTDDGRVGLGNWPDDETIPEYVASFRQNLDPLVADGVPNPTGRHVWGWQLAGESVLTDRTALCRTKQGHLFYAWGQEINGPTLAKALSEAGCDYAIHLDMNPKHCGFVFSHIIDVERREMKLKLAHRDMTINPYRYVLWSPKDFFYLTLRRGIPAALDRFSWRQSTGGQPSPAWLPALHETTVTLGQLEVVVQRIARDRLKFVLRAGEKEPDAAGSRTKKLELEPQQLARAKLAVNLGHATASSDYGLAFEGKAALPLRGDYATLVISDGSPRLVLPGNSLDLSENSDAVQLPLFAHEGTIAPAARERGAKRPRSVLCVHRTGDVLIATAVHDSTDPLVMALLELGCRDVVALDRGSHHPAFIHRAGTSTPPGEYETTVLYGLDQPLLPNTFAWGDAPQAD